MQKPLLNLNQTAAGLALPPSDVLPAYCCAILLDGRGALVLEKRPDDDADAPGRLTCFGGGRDGDEEPLACLRRELLEELGFALGQARHVLTLHTPKGPAWFYEAGGPEQGTVVTREAGHGVCWVGRGELFAQHLADWHRAALVGWSAEKAEAWVEAAAGVSEHGNMSRDADTGI